MHPNLYVEYGNMIHFSITAIASKGWLDMGRIYNQIWEDGLYVPGYISESIALIAK